MATYGERVQFALTTPGTRPNYQVFNDADKKKAFDSNHHLLHPQPSEFEGSNASAILTLDQVKAITPGKAKPKAKAKASAKSPTAKRTTTASVKAADLVDAAKYEYFRANRHTLPTAIGGHSDEIGILMRDGLSAEDAFSEVLKRHF